jgi:hypothetical protein
VKLQVRARFLLASKPTREGNGGVRTHRVVALVFVVGCSHHTSAPEPTGPLAVVVTRNAAPVAGATVAFGDVDGALRATAITDASGAAATDLAVAQVTVIDPGQPTRLFTVAHVQPGTAITIPLDAIPNPALPTIAMLTVQAPPNAPPTGTFDYLVQTGCGSYFADALPKTIAIAAECIGRDGNVPVVLEAETQNTSLENPGMPVAFSAGLATPSGSNFALAPPAWSTGCRGIDIANPKPMSLQVWPRYDGLELRGADAAFCHPIASAGFDYAYPLIDLDPGVTVATFGYVSGSLRMTFKTLDLPTTPSHVAAEHDPDVLSGDAELHVLDANGAAWSASPELAAADLVLAELSYSRATQTFVRWRIVEPSWATVADLPELPASAGDYGLAAATRRFGELHFIDASWLGNFTDSQRALTIVLDPASAGTRLPIGGWVREYREQFYPDTK